MSNMLLTGWRRSFARAKSLCTCRSLGVYIAGGNQEFLEITRWITFANMRVSRVSPILQSLDNYELTKRNGENS